MYLPFCGRWECKEAQTVLNVFVHKNRHHVLSYGVYVAIV